MACSRIAAMVLSRTRKRQRLIPPSPDEKLTPSTPAPLHITALPTEILQHIATFLPLESEATLALTCHHMKNVLGMRSWFHLSRNLRGYEKHIRSGRWLFLPGALENLLILLARDMDPGTSVVCLHHLTIHTRRKGPRGYLRWKGFRCKRATDCIHHSYERTCATIFADYYVKCVGGTG